MRDDEVPGAGTQDDPVGPAGGVDDLRREPGSQVMHMLNRPGAMATLHWAGNDVAASVVIRVGLTSMGWSP